MIGISTSFSDLKYVDYCVEYTFFTNNFLSDFILLKLLLNYYYKIKFITLSTHCSTYIVSIDAYTVY